MAVSDDDVRIHVYERFVADGRPPSPGETAAALGVSPEEAEAAYRRLEAARVLVFAPGSPSIWLAQPLCASPSQFRVETPRGEFWAVCAWDALGVAAMLGGDGVVHTHCPDCGEPLRLTVRERRLVDGDGVAHFSVRARSWWENIVFT